MATYFADTSYHVAIIEPRDQLHDKALRLAARFSSADRFVTSDTVLVEFLTNLSGHGEAIRQAAGSYARMVFDDPRVVVVPQSPELFAHALDLYQQRADKTYSMCDCISMVICRARRITDVLTYDHDFEQEGFRALLRQ